MLTRSVNVRLSAEDFNHVATISRAVAQRTRDSFPDRSTAVRYAVGMVGKIIEGDLLDHVETLLSPGDRKSTQ